MKKTKFKKSSNKYLFIDFMAWATKKNEPCPCGSLCRTGTQHFNYIIMSDSEGNVKVLS